MQTSWVMMTWDGNIQMPWLEDKCEIGLHQNLIQFGHDLVHLQDKELLQIQLLCE